MRSQKLSLLTFAIVFLAVPSIMLGQSAVMSLPANGFSKQANQFNANAKKNWDSIADFCKQVSEAEKANDLASIDCEEVGPAYAIARQILREGQALKNMREPAGVDWMHRGKFCADTLLSATGKLKTTTLGKEMSLKAEKYKEKSMKKRANAVAKVVKLFDKGQIGKAEVELDAILQEVDRFAPWLSPASGRQVYGQPEGIRRNMALRTKELREAEASQALSAALKSHPPKIDELIDEANAALKSVKATGTATVDGKSVNGPDAVKVLFTKWQSSHSNLLRSMGIAWIGKGLPVEAEATPEKLLGTKLNTKSYSEAITKLSAQMNLLLPNIVEASLQQTNDTNALDTYVGHLRTVGFMSNNVPDQLIDAIEKKLTAMESSPAIGERIKNYKKVSGDALLWRSRIVKAARKSVAATPEILPATESLNKYSYIPTLTVGLDVVAANLNENAMGFETHVKNARALNGNAAFGNFRKRVWATAIGNLDVTPEVTALREDLFIGQGSPPLTVAAARSFATASRKSFSAIGGPVSKVQLEAMGSRFPKLPASMNSLIPLDYCPTENTLFEDMLLRFNITPKWIEHPHFFKKF